MPKIAFVDDDPDIRDLVEIALAADPSIEVRCFATGAEFRTALASWTPRLALFDVNMPGESGPELLQHVQSLGEDGPRVVFLTADSRPAARAALEAQGAAGVITKPFDPMTLAEAVKVYL